MWNPRITLHLWHRSLALAATLLLASTAWAANGRYTLMDIGPQAAVYGNTEMTPGGDILGISTVPDGRSLATLWQAGVYLPIVLTPDPSVVSSAPSAISSNGRYAVGEAETDRVRYRPWLWTAKDGLTFLPNWRPWLVDDTFVDSVNNAGTAVGWVLWGPMDARTGLLWQDGTVVDVNTLLDPQTAAAWRILEASLITNQGVIAGTMISRSTGIWHDYLLIPQGKQHD